MRINEIEIPDTIDGKPTRNSLGKLIHPTVEGIRNFWNWFGDSKVVDSQGRPLVMYHGTRTGGFDEFKPVVKKSQQLGFGVHFTPDESLADMYATDEKVAKKGKTPQVFLVYLKAENPLQANAIVKDGSVEFDLAKKLALTKFYTVKDESGTQTAYLQNAIDSTTPSRAEKLIKQFGYDSVNYTANLRQLAVSHYTSIKSSDAIVVFDSNQIKSAIGNNGNFSSSNKKITEKRNANK